MGDSGSQLIGFLLAVARSRVELHRRVVDARDAAPAGARPRRPDPRHDARDGRAAARRPARSSQGGRDHSSHRLVSLGSLRDRSRRAARAISAALGATSLAYEAFGNGRLAAIGVLVTFALLIQFGSLLADVDRGRQQYRRAFLGLHAPARRGRSPTARVIAASFLAAFLLRFNGLGTPNQRHYFLLSLPAILFCRYVALIALRAVLERLALRQLARRAARGERRGGLGDRRRSASSP